MKAWKRVGMDEVKVGDVVYFMRYGTYGDYVPAKVVKKGRKRIYLEYTIGLMKKNLVVNNVFIPYEWDINLEKEMRFLYYDVPKAGGREGTRKLLRENGYNLVDSGEKHDIFRKENLNVGIYYNGNMPIVEFVEDTETGVQYYRVGWNIERAIEMVKEVASAKNSEMEEQEV